MIKITTLVENTATKAKFRAEHGLSMLIEKDGEYILWDTGQTDAIVHNAKLLNVDLKKIKIVALSHGHYDHVGGLKYLLDYTKPVVYGHPEIFRKRYSKLSDDGNLRYIGIEDREYFENKGARFILNDKPQEIFDGIFTSGFEDMHTDFEEVDKNFVYEKDGEYVKDYVDDDMSLAIELDRGMFVLFGCAHRGIINIIDDVENHFNKKVIGFLGGTHLGPASSSQRERTLKELKKRDYIEIIGPSHCTGMLMSAKLYCSFPDKTVFNNVGSVTVIEE
jgi:7,8-dihydropterin-6-yl-methyl-4-(beta-D-ribofuranosyl)aminobenzene 5'-phosphate synthase